MNEEPKRRRLGEILIEKKVLKEEDLEKALEIQKREGGLIGEILVSKGFVSEEEVVIALAEQFNYPYMPVSSFVINQDAVHAIPEHLALEYVCIALDKVGNRLAVAMSDPSNKNAVWAIERASGCRVQAFVSTLSEIEAAIARCYRKELEVHGKGLGARLGLILKDAADRRREIS
ncbi:MAG: hypothetical protein HY714_02720 [Candidatus Omnitrophica bacterium]|nr:hypothetical protein [Candidatus Omnitrophota bacterium]